MPAGGPVDPRHLNPRQRAQLGANRGQRQGQGSPRVTGIVPKPFRPAGRLGSPAVQSGLNILGLQHFLRNKGFNIAADGKLGPATRAALRDAVDKGILSHPTQEESHLIAGMHGQVLGPKGFNALEQHAGHAPFLQHAFDKHGNSSGNAMGGVNAGSAVAQQSGSPYVSSGSTQQAIKAAAGQKLDPSEANFGQLFNIDKTANAIAQEQFQPQINEQQLTVNRDPLQAAQNEKDVADWYNQVQAAQQQAAGNDATATKQGVDATNAATQALVQSLGGSANQGSGDVAAAGANAAGTLQAIGASQAGLDQSLAPILAAQATQQKTNQANIDQQKQQNDQQVLQDLQGQQGNAETGAQMQLMAANNSLDQARQNALMQIQQYNNSLGQQKFQNRLGLLSTQVAAAMNGVNMGEKAAMARYYGARARAYAHGGGGSRSASQLNDIQSAILGNLISRGLITGGSGQPYKMVSGVNPRAVLRAAQQAGSGYGSLPGGFIPNTVLSGIQGY